MKMIILLCTLVITPIVYCGKNKLEEVSLFYIIAKRNIVTKFNQGSSFIYYYSNDSTQEIENKKRMAEQPPTIIAVNNKLQHRKSNL